MLRVVETRQFRKDKKRCKKRGLDLELLFEVVEILVSGDEPDADKYQPHPLKGAWKPSWELHIRPDWLLVYQVTDTELILVATGSHSDLF